MVQYRIENTSKGLCGTNCGRDLDAKTPARVSAALLVAETSTRKHQRGSLRHCLWQRPRRENAIKGLCETACGGDLDLKTPARVFAALPVAETSTRKDQRGSSRHCLWQRPRRENASKGLCGTVCGGDLDARTPARVSANRAVAETLRRKDGRCILAHGKVFFL
ncbi:hypothetical protein QAD02_008254 [Eretmocerus hayati]|uniref:Uncharacterized protein n=1 Tax=Eretmocerus hayati TaxID=131215 RepID=A0ACC2N691_9HYME|nr:hypothetical protein QAD02_008254 [Eretmocerus hayati]